MEREIRKNDYILIICVPKYKAKSDNRVGGLGYEWLIALMRLHWTTLQLLYWCGALPKWLSRWYPHVRRASA